MINSNRITSMVTIYRPAHIDSLAIAEGRRKQVGFTLVELLVSMCVSLMLLGGVVSLFGTLGESVNDSKSNGEMLHTMRHASRQLQSDLGNVSLVPDPAETQTNPQGFFEYIEGPFNDRAAFSTDPIEQPCPDPMVIDNADAFTSESTSKLTLTGGNQGKASVDGKVHRAYSKFMKGSGQWKKTGLDNGTYRVSITWPTDWNSSWASKHESNVPVTISSGDNTQTVSVDQTQVPSDLVDPELVDGNNPPRSIKWHDLGEIDVTNGQLAVQIGPCGPSNGYTQGGKLVFADAIRIECLELDPITQDNSAGTLSLVGDCDDVLHFTTKTDEGALEVVWFLTAMPGYENKVGNEKRYRLHRYKRKVNPDATLEDDLNSPISLVKDQRGNPASLMKIAQRENRFAHEKRTDANGNLQDNNGDGIADCFNPVTRQNYEDVLDSESYYLDGSVRDSVGERTRKTVILENILAFDVQAYDPEVGIYRATDSDGQIVPLLPSDPGWGAAHQNADTMPAIGKGAFRDLDPAQADDLHSPLKTLSTASGPVATYDSWSGDYVKNGEVGFDNWNSLTGQQEPDGIVDTAEDLREAPPYDAPLKAVQVEIRVQEPKSGKVRSVKVRKFLGKR